MFQKIKCFFGKHKYEVIQTFSDGCQRIGCPVCKKEWAINHIIKSLLPWDFEFQSMYRNIFEHKIINPRWYKD